MSIFILLRILLVFSFFVVGSSLPNDIDNDYLSDGSSEDLVRSVEEIRSSIRRSFNPESTKGECGRNITDWYLYNGVGWMYAFTHKNPTSRNFCPVVLLSAEVVVTVASCLRSTITHDVHEFGVITFTQQNDVDSILLQRSVDMTSDIKTLRWYDSRDATYRFNIALIRIDYVNFTFANPTPISLMYNDFKIESNATLIGYGKKPEIEFNENSTGIDYRNHGDYAKIHPVQIQSLGYCNRFYSYQLCHNLTVAATEDGCSMVPGCGNHNGSPLFMFVYNEQLRIEEMRLAGLLSIPTLLSCSPYHKTDHPSLFLNIAPFASWIDGYM